MVGNYFLQRTYTRRRRSLCEGRASLNASELRQIISDHGIVPSDLTLDFWKDIEKSSGVLPGTLRFEDELMAFFPGWFFDLGGVSLDTTLSCYDYTSTPTTTAAKTFGELFCAKAPLLK